MSKRRPKPLALADYEMNAHNRDEAIYLAYMSGGYTLKDIGQHFGLYYSRVSRIFRMAKDKTWSIYFLLIVTKAFFVFIISVIKMLLFL